MYKTASRTGKHHSKYDLAGDLEHIKDALADASIDVKGKINEYLTQSVHDMRVKGIDVKDSVGDYIVEKPYKSVGIALITGLLFGIYLRRR